MLLGECLMGREMFLENGVNSIRGRGNFGCAEGVAHHDGSILLPVVQILRVQDVSATGFGGREDERVPERDAVAFFIRNRRHDVRRADND